MEGKVHGVESYDSDNQEAKKLKRCESDESTNEDLLQDFSFISVLNENAQQKSMFIHGRFGRSNEDAVLLLEKTPFSAKSVVEMLRSPVKTKVVMHNDIYKTFEMLPPAEYNGEHVLMSY
jgi:Scavenger mRNA decapping enzyme (DcpS) N-terminal